MELQKQLESLLGKSLAKASDEDVYYALLQFTKQQCDQIKPITGERKLYYISAEFLIGKLLSNNLINLGLYDEVDQLLKANNHDLSKIEEIENEPSLGNGGLGRLAACFLDSIATLGLQGDGVGLNYHFGLFKQLFKDNKQVEEPNPWLTKQSWLRKTDTSWIIHLDGITVKSVMYDLDVPGYNGGKNTLHLFDVDTVDERIVKKGIDFDKTDIAKNLTLFLYPDDSDMQGQLLRIYQQYFMCSNAARLILKEEKEKGHDLRDLAKYVAVQINDTHPTMVIPELIRLLMKEGITMKEAISIVTDTCAYTNHTILAEALEKWPRRYLAQVVPQLMPIIEALDTVVNAVYKDPNVQIIDDEDRVHMARIDMHCGHSINGVAAIHTEILKNTELKPFYDIYPEKFNNKTNGITFRRWLMHCNHELSQYIDSLIGEDWKQDASKLEDLLRYYDDENVLNSLENIKQNRKNELATYLKQNEGIEIDPNSIFCIQVKRLHEYKRQQMNALYIIWKYLKIKKGEIPNRPITVIFGAKAAPAYKMAKNIIHLLLCLQQLIDNDPVVSKYLKVVFVTNYNVTYAQHLIPACDISEQISLASKEASGTGNMKFMLNGAVTLGTDDGANVEIHNLVGNDNIYTFGQSSDEIIRHYQNSDYHPIDYYNKDEVIKEIVDFITSDELCKIGDKESLLALQKELMNKDWFMTLLDLDAYCDTKERMINDYDDREKWKRMMLVNIAKAGFFSSDRTIAEYDRDIWKLKG